MSSRSRWVIIAITTPLVALVGIGGLLGAAAPRTGQRVPGAATNVLEDVMSLIYQAYVEPVNWDRVMDGAMRGLVESLDSESAYLPPAEVRLLDSGAPLPPADIGVVLTRQFWLRVVGIRDGSPAAAAGLLSGDLIRMIDNVPTRDMSALTGARRLRGEPGTKVRILVVRGNAADPHELELVRAIPAAPPVAVTRQPDRLAVVRVTSFAQGAVAAMRNAFAELQTERVPGAVLDLRDTADGTAADAIAAARLFIKTGAIAIRAGRGADRVTTEAQPGDGAVTLKLAVLVSNGTGHAAEILAAALVGQGRAELIGEPTAGLAAEQKLVRLPDSHGLWLTHARYFTVDGKDPIHQRGVRPTIGVEIPTPGFDEVRPTTDAPLARALDHLRGK